MNNLTTKDKTQPGMKLIIPREAHAATARVASVAPAPQKTPEKGFSKHRVRPGESLWTIAIQYNSTVQDLFKWNDLHRSRIYPGMVLRVKKPKDIAKAQENDDDDDDDTDTTEVVSKTRAPDSQKYLVHIVENGDSLWSIAQVYNVRVENLKRWNHLSSARLMPGKRLRIKSN